MQRRNGGSMARHSSIRRALAAACAMVLLANAPATAQGVAECVATAAICVGQCKFADLIGGGGTQACRQQCATQQQQCQRQALTPTPTPTAPPPKPAAGFDPGAPMPSAPAPSTAPPKPTAVTGSAAATAHPLPVKRFTTSDAIVPVELPIIDGLPVLAYPFIGQHDVRMHPPLQRGNAHAARWMLLMEVAQRPELLDQWRRALRVAANFLPPAEWDNYFQCGMTAGDPPMCGAVLNNNRQQASYELDGLARHWKGANEFERERAHQAFVAKYGPIFKAQAARLPVEAIYITSVKVDTYKSAEGLLPVHGLAAAGATALRQPLAGSYCAPIAMQWPAGLTLGPAEAEALINRLDRRNAYLGMRLRLLRNLPSDGSADACTFDATLLDHAVYLEPTLKTKLLKLPLKALPQPASTVSGSRSGDSAS